MKKSMVAPDLLKVLICDAAPGSAESLRRIVESNGGVLTAKGCDNLEEARSEILAGDFNTIFIDPLSFNLDEASSIIFEIRKAFPGILFVLYLDLSQAERIRTIFFRGERRRFSHYYQLDKRTPVAAFAEEVAAIIHLCRSDLNRRISSANLEPRLEKTARSATAVEPKSRAVPTAAGEIVLGKPESSSPKPGGPSSRTVFLSHRFAPEEYVHGLIRLLEQKGFEVITAGSSNTYLSLWVIDRIQRAGFFLSLMTRAEAKTDGTYTTSPWLLEEKGAAFAFGKPVLLLVEEGVSDFGGLQGDWQRINFGPAGFQNAALEAAARLAAYAGFGREPIPAVETASSAAPRKVRLPAVGPKRITDR